MRKARLNILAVVLVGIPVRRRLAADPEDNMENSKPHTFGKSGRKMITRRSKDASTRRDGGRPQR